MAGMMKKTAVCVCRGIRFAMRRVPHMCPKD